MDNMSFCAREFHADYHVTPLLVEPSFLNSRSTTGVPMFHTQVIQRKSTRVFPRGDDDFFLPDKNIITFPTIHSTTPTPIPTTKFLY